MRSHATTQRCSIRHSRRRAARSRCVIPQASANVSSHTSPSIYVGVQTCTVVPCSGAVLASVDSGPVRMTTTRLLLLLPLCHSISIRPSTKTQQLALPMADWVQGWSNPDDAAKRGRGACTSGKTTSYMAEATEHTQPASALLDITLRGANESRLQELYQLYMRKHATGPGPGTHEVPRPPRIIS